MTFTITELIILLVVTAAVPALAWWSLREESRK